MPNSFNNSKNQAKSAGLNISNNYAPNHLGYGNYSGGSGGGGLVFNNQINLPSSHWFGNQQGLMNPIVGNHVTSYEIFEFSLDILTLSVAWNRLRKNNDPASITSITDSLLFDKVIPEDHLLVTKIREYYSKKIMLFKLKGKLLTPFREDLNKFIHATAYTYTKTVFGLAYRLPDFYKYDISLDEIRMELQETVPCLVEHLDLVNVERSPPMTKTLRPIKKLYKITRNVTRYEYWFADIFNGLYVISIEPKNPLIHMWNTAFETSTQMDIHGTYTAKTLDELCYCYISKWQLTN